MSPRPPDPRKQILVVDDDPHVQRILGRIIERQGWTYIGAIDAEEALAAATEHNLDLVLLDIHLPGRDGREVLKELRRNPRTQMVPVAMLTGDALLDDKIVGFELGADDYITKPFEPKELEARIQSIFRRSHRDLAANPLTRLPGSPMIEEQISTRIRDGRTFCFFHIDIDHFKAFNDAYGYAKGDGVIQDTAGIILNAVRAVGAADDFVGHVGGDDFVVVAEPAVSEGLAMAIVKRFDEMVAGCYSEADRACGFVITRDRLGIERHFPLMSVSIAIASNERRTLAHYAQVVDIADEIKRYLKSLPNRTGSVFLKDRRTDAPADIPDAVRHAAGERSNKPDPLIHDLAIPFSRS